MIEQTLCRGCGLKLVYPENPYCTECLKEDFRQVEEGEFTID